MAAVIDYLDHKEINLCLKINRLGRSAQVRRVFAVISKLGDGGFWLLAAFGIIAIQGKAALVPVMHIAATGTIGVGLYKLLKHHLVRERPYINHHGIECGTAPLDRYSFPSGHTLHAVSFTIMMGSVEPLLLPVIVPFAVLVAASRVILGLHYPSDVVAGALIGVTLATASLALM